MREFFRGLDVGEGDGGSAGGGGAEEVGFAGS